jgi:hypothetical protein
MHADDGYELKVVSGCSCHEKIATHTTQTFLGFHFFSVFYLIRVRTGEKCPLVLPRQ